MRSKLRRVAYRLLILPFTVLALLLSACTTTSVTLYAPSCFTEMTQTRALREPTPHAPLPSKATAGAWVDQANQEAGQTDKANSRAETVLHIGDTCDRFLSEAKQKAERKPFFKRIFG